MRGRASETVLTGGQAWRTRSEEHTSELQSQSNLVCRLLLEKKKTAINHAAIDANTLPFTRQQAELPPVPRTLTREHSLSAYKRMQPDATDTVEPARALINTN